MSERLVKFRWVKSPKTWETRWGLQEISSEERSVPRRSRFKTSSSMIRSLRMRDCLK